MSVEINLFRGCVYKNKSFFIEEKVENALFKKSYFAYYSETLKKVFVIGFSVGSLVYQGIHFEKIDSFVIVCIDGR